MPNAGTEVITVNECLNTVECRVFKTDSGIPAALYGAESEKIFLCVHGQFGNKFEAESFARIAVPLGWQVLAVDLPEHGERAGNSSARFDPWHSVPELHGIISSLRSKNKRVALRAVSIGAWFSLLAARGISLECCLLVSPLLNMERMIADMMRSANISEDTLKEVREIVVPNGPCCHMIICCMQGETLRRFPAAMQKCSAVRMMPLFLSTLLKLSAKLIIADSQSCLPANIGSTLRSSANSCPSGKVQHSPNSEFKQTLNKINFRGSY